MSKFANIFLQALNEEKEGNAFTAGLAKTKKGGTFKLNGKTVKDTSNYDSSKVKKEEKEGNAFTAGLAKTKKGGTFNLNGKTVKDTSDYDDSTVKEGKMTPDEKKERSKLGKTLSTKEFNKRYGKDKGKSIKYATATKLAMHKESVFPEAEEEPETTAPAAEPSDEDAWKASLDKGTNPADFDVEDNPQLNIDTSGVEAARQWIAKLEEMAEFVNGTGPESLNSKINELEVKNSIPFRGVVRREEKRITKVAENLRGLAEVFKSVVITSQKKIKDANER